MTGPGVLTASGRPNDLSTSSNRLGDVCCALQRIVSIRPGELFAESSRSMAVVLLRDDSPMAAVVCCSETIRLWRCGVVPRRFAYGGVVLFRDDSPMAASSCSERIPAVCAARGSGARGISTIDPQDGRMTMTSADAVRLLARSRLQRQRVRAIEALVFARIRDGDPSPTIREIATHLGVAISTAQASLSYALATGRLVHDAATPRSLRPGATLRFEVDALALTNHQLTDEQYRALTASVERSRELIEERLFDGRADWSVVVAAVHAATIAIANELSPVRRVA